MMSTDSSKDKDSFQIGEEVLLDGLPEDARQDDALKEIRVRVGTLLKTETVSLLLGAGASVGCGGVLIGSVPISVERQLIAEGIAGTQRPRVSRWLRIFYEAVKLAGDNESPVTRENILVRREEFQSPNPTQLKANFEEVLSTLQRWRTVLPENGGRLRLDGSIRLTAKGEDINKCLKRASHALARACVLSIHDEEQGHKSFITLVHKLLTRPLNLKRVNIFTLNYDTLVEQAADATGTVLLDGFVGTQRRIFHPESYEQDLYFPAETTEGRVHRLDRVLHLYKLHGSITWTAVEPQFDNPYGVESAPFQGDESRALLIYPTPAKPGEALGMPYSELFRRFAGTLVRPQSVLFVIGYGFGDAHVNAIIRQALAVPSFTLVIVGPSPGNPFVETLREQQDRRIWISEGSRLGTFAGFVKEVLPDLHDEDILRKVLATYKTLAQDGGSEQSSSSGN